MRTFIAIDLPEEIKKEVKKIQDNLPEFSGKKAELENLHLTLKFLGEIDDDKVEEVKEKLGKIKLEKFPAIIDRIGVFSDKFVKIIWLHMDGFEKLQKEIDSKLKGLFEPEKRFMSHLTIARVKSIKDKKEFLEKLKRIKIPTMKFIVSNFKLKKSTLTPQAPIYEDIEIYALK